MRTAPEQAASASRVSAQKSRRVDIAVAQVHKASKPLSKAALRIADQGESRVNLIWDRRLVQEDRGPTQGTGATRWTPRCN